MDEWYGNDKVFRGYLLGDTSKNGSGKRPAKGEKIKDGPGRSFDEVCDSECFGGILRDDFVDISFDSIDMFDTFLDIADANGWKCLALRSKHGGHSYWRKSPKIDTDGKDKKLACGLVADIHGKNVYAPLRVFGENRFPPEYDLDEKFGDKDYDIVPDALLPVSTDIDLWKMKYGEGRNESLFKYILILQSQLKLRSDEIRTLYKTIINKYILADPVDELELNTILRDEAFETQIRESFFKGRTFLHEECAEYIISMHHVIKRNGKNLYIFEDGVYTRNENAIARIIRSYVPGCRKNHKTEVLDYMKDCAPEKQLSDKRYIAFKNGIYDLKTDKLMDFSPDIVLINMIPWDYDPEAYSEIADRTLNNVADGDPEIRALLEECIGYCFYRGTQFRKAFLLTGNKRNGKSTYLEMLMRLLGEENCSTLDLGELAGRFNKALLLGKLVNISDDTKSTYMEGAAISLFKKIVAGNTINAEFKGETAFDYKPYAKIIASANDIPRMQDWTGAALDRMIIIPFNRTFSEDDPDYDPDLADKLKEEEVMKYLVQTVVKGIKRILKNQRFTRSEKVEQKIKEYGEENDSVLAFINSCDPEAQIINHSVKEVRIAYEQFCTENGLTAATAQLPKRIDAQLNLKRESRKLPLIGNAKCYVRRK